MSSLPSIPDDPGTHYTEIENYLYQLQSYLDELLGDSPAIYPHIIGFKDGTARTNWASYILEVGRFKTIAEFWVGARGGKKSWLALCCVPVRNWIKDGDTWKNGNWHCFAVAVLSRQEGGKGMIIYDPEPNTGSKTDRAMHILAGLQRDFWTYLKGRSGRNNSL